MVSYEGSIFAEDMGYREGGELLDEKLGGWNRGVSAFRKDKHGKIWRLSDAEFGPWDAFCIVWHLFDLFPESADGFRPKYNYG